MSTIRECLRANKIFFETIGWLCLSLMAIGITWFQGCMASKQNGLVERQTDYIEQQTKLLEIQTRVAQRSVSPHFDFIYEMEGGPHKLLVKNRGVTAYDLVGECVAFLEYRIHRESEWSSERPRRIRVDGMIASEDKRLSTGNLHFYHTHLLPLNRELRLSLSEHYLNKDLILAGEFRCHFTFRYIDLTGERRVETYIVSMSGGDVEPGAAMPQFDDTLDISPFLAEKQTDFATAGRAIVKIIDSIETKKERK